MKIGIFGGSFNPIHIGHMIIAENFYSQLQLDKVLFIPTSISPFKTDQIKEISDEVRLDMVKNAIKNDSRFGVDDYEIICGNVSYTYNTILYLKQKYQQSELYLLIGYDNLKDIDKWYEFDKLCQLVTFCVSSRIVGLKEELTLISHVQIDSPLIEVSSSDIRNRIKSGKSFRYMLLPRTYETIVAENLYK
jgi:nicotinate-nucleotide adenylyltransferase